MSVCSYSVQAPWGAKAQRNTAYLSVSVAVPATMLVARSHLQALAAASITKAKRSTARLKMAVITDDKKAGRPKKARKLRNVTNAHLAHLFDDDGADGAIDR